MTDDLGHYYLDAPLGAEGVPPDAVPREPVPPDAVPREPVPSPGADVPADAVSPGEASPDPTQWAGSERDLETQALDRLRFLGGREVATHEPIPLDVPRLLPDARRLRLRGRVSGLHVARFAAPIIFLVAVVVIVSILGRTVLSGSSKATPHKPGAAATKAARPARKYYVVKAGQSLSQISAKTGVTISQLMALNPQITDPANLRIGLKIKLPPPSQ
jgi:LysM repeat protein